MKKRLENFSFDSWLLGFIQCSIVAFGLNYAFEGILHWLLVALISGFVSMLYEMFVKSSRRSKTERGDQAPVSKYDQKGKGYY